MSSRRGSRLFSGQPGLLLVSEDIPGITMPAPPVSAPPLEDEEPDFDLALFHAEEDREAEEAGHDGPLRVFLGSETVEMPGEDGDDAPVFDVSALAMPAGPTDDTPLDFLDDSVDVDEDDIVDLVGSAPPTLSMGVSTDLQVDSDERWSSDQPTNPGAAASSTVVIRDTPPARTADLSPSTTNADEFEDFGDPFADYETSDALPQSVEDPQEVVWDDDDTGFFDNQPVREAGLPPTPPRLNLDVPSESRTFRAIPDKEDPPVLLLVILLIGIAIMAVVLTFREVGVNETGGASVPAPQPPAPTAGLVPNIQPAPRTGPIGQAGEVERAIGYLSIDSDESANIYVDDKKVGITPVVKTEVSPGRHHVIAVEILTGKRKALTADVTQGEERRVRFVFQPVQ